MADIFVNYRTDDEPDAAVLVAETLTQRFGDDRVFLDNRSIELGAALNVSPSNSAASFVVVVVVIGKRWLAEESDGQRGIDNPFDFLRREIAPASRLGIRVLPVLVGDVPPLRADQLPADVAALANPRYLRLAATGASGAQSGLTRLVNEIASILPPAGAEPSATRSTSTTGAPDPTGTTALVQLADASCRMAAGRMLHFAVAGAAGQARLRDIDIRPVQEGGAVSLFAPVSVPPVQIMADFVRALDETLGMWQLNELRAKVGVQQIVGHDLVAADLEVARLVGLPILDSVLRHASRARLVLVVSDSLYTGVARSKPHPLDPATFLSTPRIDHHGTLGWVHVPGYPCPPGLARIDHDRMPARGVPRQDGVAFTNNGPMHGDQYGGDRVEDIKNVYHGNGRTPR